MDRLIKNFCKKLFSFIIVLSIPAIINAAVIKGRITDTETHKPISGAAISIAGSNRVTVSDAKGSFILNNLKPGTYTIVVSCMGYTVPNP